MSWYTVTKIIKSIPYIYRQRSRREGKTVKTESHLIGRADGGGRSRLTIQTYDQEPPQNIPIGVNTTRLSFHGARDGFYGSPRPSVDGRLGPGFYLSTEKRAELFRLHVPKIAADYDKVGLDIEPEYDGDLVEFDLRHLTIKQFRDWTEWLDWRDDVSAAARQGGKPYASYNALLTDLQKTLETEGYNAMQLNDPDEPEMVVFPSAVRQLRRIGVELTLHLKQPSPDKS